MEDPKSNKQTAFWQSMMHKYQQRNTQLEEQQCHLRHRLEAIECSMPAALMQKMNQSPQRNQIDFVKFISQLGRPHGNITTTSSSILSSCPCQPCFSGGFSNTIQTEMFNSISSGSCSCSTCTTDSKQQPSVASDSCPCGPCTEAQSNIKDEASSNGSCTCNPCGSPEPSVGSGSFDNCPCAEQQPSVRDNSSSCSSPCDPCTEQKQELHPLDLCLCDPCLAKQESIITDNLSLFSIQSADLICMTKLNELVNKEREMKRQLLEMEHREQAYMETLKKADEMWACMEGNYQQQLSNIQQSGDTVAMKFEKITEQLMEENTRLTDELKDAKLELKQCMERIQGPLSRQLEKERRKSDTLEQQLLSATKTMSGRENSYLRDMNNLQNQFDCTCRNLCDLNATNEQLKKDLCMLQCKYNQLQKDLINQKLSEAHTIERLTEAICKEKAMMEEKKQAEPEDENLNDMARRLSETLIDVEKCNQCTKLPADLKDTVKGIKGIMDIVSKEGEKSKQKTPSKEVKSKDSKDDGGDDEDHDKKGPPCLPSDEREPSDQKEGKESKDQPTSTTASDHIGLDVSVQSADRNATTDVETETDVKTVSKATSENLSRESSCKKLSKRSSEKLRSESKKSSERVSRTSSEVVSKHSIRRGSELISKESSKTKGSRVSIQEPAMDDEGTPMAQTMEMYKDSLASLDEQEIEVITEVEADADVEVEVETEVNIYETVSDGINITTTITGSGTLEVITEGPTGVIETIMTYTESGNIDITTEITEYPTADYQPKIGLDAPVSSVSKITTSSVSRVTTDSSFTSRKSSITTTDVTPSRETIDYEELRSTRPSLKTSKAASCEDVCAPEYIKHTEKSCKDVCKEKAEQRRLAESVSEVTRLGLTETESEAMKTEISETEEEPSTIDVSAVETETEEEASEMSIAEEMSRTSEIAEAGQEAASQKVSEISKAEEIAEAGEVVETLEMEKAAEVSKITEEAEEIEKISEIEPEVSQIEEKASVASEAASESIAEAAEAAEATPELVSGVELEAEAPEEIIEHEPEKMEVPEASKAEEETEIPEVTAIEVPAAEEEVPAAEEEVPAAEEEVPAAEEVVPATTERTVDKSEVTIEAPPESKVPEASKEELSVAEIVSEAEVYADAAETSPELVITIEVSEEEPQPQYTMDIEATISTEEKGDVPLKHEFISEEPFVLAEDNLDDLRKGVTEAMVKANKDVMDALEQANKNVTDALDKANKDVEIALAAAVKDSQTLANKQAFIAKEVLQQTEDGKVPAGGEVSAAASPAVSITAAAAAASEVTPPPEIFSSTTEIPADESSIAETTSTLTPATSVMPDTSVISGGTDVTSETPAMPEVASEAISLSVKEEEYFESAVSIPVGPAQADAAEPGYFDGIVESEKPPLPLSESERCKDVCSPIYDQKQEEICLDICAEDAKKKLPDKLSETTTEPSTMDVEFVKEQQPPQPLAASETVNEQPSEITMPSPITQEKSEESAQVSDEQSIMPKEDVPSVRESITPAVEIEVDTVVTVEVSESVEGEVTGKSAEKLTDISVQSSGTPSHISSSIPIPVKSPSLQGSRSSSKQSDDRRDSKASSKKSAKPSESTRLLSEDRSKVKVDSRRPSSVEEGKRTSYRRSSSKTRSKDSRRSSLTRSKEAVDGKSKSSPRPSEEKSSRTSSRIPLPTKRRSKLADIVCDCGDCDCVICSPVIMRMREETRIMRGGKPNDCTCMPDCGCNVCAQHGAPGGGAVEAEGGAVGAEEGAGGGAIGAEGGAVGAEGGAVGAGGGAVGSERGSVGSGGGAVGAEGGAVGAGGGAVGAGRGSVGSGGGADGTGEKLRSQSVCSNRLSQLELDKCPPNCDCLECLCDPCGSTSDLSEIKPHPPDCDCLSCLCDPCGLLEEPCGLPEEPCGSPKKLHSITEKVGSNSMREIFKQSSSRKMSSSCDKDTPSTREHIEGCDCLVCRCCACPDHKKEQNSQQEVPVKSIKRKFPPEQCTCRECLCLEGKPPSKVLLSKISVSKKSSTLTDYTTKKSQSPTETSTSVISSTTEPPMAVTEVLKEPELHSIVSSKPEEFEEEPPSCLNPPHSKECDCIDCLTNCVPVCALKPIQQLPPPPKEEEFGTHPADCTCLDCSVVCGVKCTDPKAILAQENLEEMEETAIRERIQELERENQQRNKEMEELKQLVEKIQCACRKAEANAIKCGPSEKKAFTTKQTSYIAKMSELELAMQDLQNKCKEKDCMIEVMTEELKMRDNNKSFDNIKLTTTKESRDVDYDHRKICNFQPHPGNQTKKPSSPQRCAHIEYPKCPCTTQIPKQEEIKQQNFHGPDCDCPDCSRTCNDTCPNPPRPIEIKEKQESYNGPECDCTDCSKLCGETCPRPPKKKEEQKLVQPGRTCNHKNFPNCPCTMTDKKTELPAPSPFTATGDITPNIKKTKRLCICPNHSPSNTQNAKHKKSTKSLQPCPRSDGTCPCPPSKFKSSIKEKGTSKPSFKIAEVSEIKPVDRSKRKSCKCNNEDFPQKQKSPSAENSNKATHAPDCGCSECQKFCGTTCTYTDDNMLQLEIENEDIPEETLHGPDCDCSDCAPECGTTCPQPKPESKDSEKLQINEENEEEFPIRTKSTHDKECDCSECLKTCGTACAYEKKSSHEEGCECFKCIAGDDTENAKKSLQHTESSGLEIQEAEPKEIRTPLTDDEPPAWTEPDVHSKECDCVECSKVCGITCSYEKKSSFVVQEQTATHGGTCQCSHCIEEERERKDTADDTKMSPAPQTSTTPAEIEPPAWAEPVHTKECDCTECLKVCGTTCSYEKEHSIVQEQRYAHGEGCQCSHCIEDAKRTPAPPTEPVHDKECDCSECLKVCNTSCAYEKKAKKTCVPFVEEESPSFTKSAHDSNCGCDECTQMCGTTCDYSPTDQGRVHGPNCNCKHCSALKSIRAKMGMPPVNDSVWHGPDCNCPICTCDTCPDSKGSQKNKQRSAGSIYDQFKRKCPGPLESKELTGTRQMPDPVFPFPSRKGYSRSPCHDGDLGRGSPTIGSSPMEVTEIRKIAADSLIIKWNAPASKHVTGYEVLVDGTTKSRVHSSQRTVAVLHALELKSSLNITIYALSLAGRCQPPTTAVFQT